MGSLLWTTAEVIAEIGGGGEEGCGVGVGGQCQRGCGQQSGDKDILSDLITTQLSISSPASMETSTSTELTNRIQQSSISLSKLLNDAWMLDNRRQNVIMKLIEAINNIKSDLEIELMAGGSQSLLGEQVVDYSEIQNLIHQSRSIKPTTTSNKLITLETELNQTKSQLQTYINANNTIDNYTSNIDSYRIVYNFIQSKIKTNLIQNPAQIFPKYFIDMEIANVCLGRIVIATRPDIAPRMCENFNTLMEGERGVGYRGCTVFQCWKRESVITGDFEYNNGRGGYSIFNKNLFLPEDTKLVSSRGAIGMRRTQKRHDSKGLVGSQFRIILQDMPGFTGIFGHVISGLNVIDKISEYGDSSGNPTVKIIIADCGSIY